MSSQMEQIKTYQASPVFHFSTVSLAREADFNWSKEAGQYRKNDSEKKHAQHLHLISTCHLATLLSPYPIFFVAQICA